MAVQPAYFASPRSGLGSGWRFSAADGPARLGQGAEPGATVVAGWRLYEHGKVVSSHAQSVSVMMTGFRMPAGSRTVSPRVNRTGSASPGTPSTRTSAVPFNISHTTGWAYGAGSSTPPLKPTFSTIKARLLPTPGTPLNNP